MECPSCSQSWSSTSTIPRILSCGHTLCESCISSRFDSSKVQCPECKSFQTFHLDRHFTDTDEVYKSNCISSLSKNFTLLSITSYQRNSADIQDFELEICDEHNHPIHSFTSKPESELCDICYEEVKDLGLDIQPLPRVLDYFNSLISKLSKLMHGNLVKLNQVLEKRRNNENNEKFKAEEQISSFFEGFLQVLDSVESSTSNTLLEKIQELEQLNSKIKLDLNERKKNLETIINEFKYLESLPDLELVQHLETCDSLIPLFKPLEEVLVLKTLSFSTSQAKLKNIKSLIDSSYKISLKKSSIIWTCSKCAATNQDGQISCQSCKLFRPIETYPHLSKHPSMASEQELHELNLRRQTEIHKISKLDKIDPKGKFYLIHAGWVNKWKEFVLNKSHDKQQNCVLPPGPICNHLLFEDVDCSVVKRKLKAAIDYRGLNKEVWVAYLEIYGGGPEIVRNKVSIYDGTGN